MKEEFNPVDNYCNARAFKFGGHEGTTDIGNTFCTKNELFSFVMYMNDVGIYSSYIVSNHNAVCIRNTLFINVISKTSLNYLFISASC